jgi:hydroxyethylthiazole kinase-like uncharacterized protein yjeF
MQAALSSPRALPLFAVAPTRAIEQRAAATLPAHALMRRAGLAVARLALAIAPHARNVWICAGPGNNGGDGLDAAIHLAAAGKAVHVSLLGDPDALPVDARDALSRAQAAGVHVVCDGGLADPDCGLAIDALLGIGAGRAPTGVMAAAIARLNALACPVLAVDVPSGLHAGTGQPIGDDAVRASHTLALLTLKPGLFTAAGRDHAGAVWFDGLGIDASSDTPQAWLSGAPSLVSPRRAHAQHKGSFGDAVVVGGAPGMTGAALLAARAAHAAGAGRVYLSLLDEAGPAHDPLRPELMFRARWWASDPGLLAGATVVCGCGGGDAVRAPLARLLGAVPRLVLDADALNAIAADTALQALLQARARGQRLTVLTPHPLEAARLLGVDTPRVQQDRLAAAQALAQRYRCTVVLKGSGSVVAAPQQVPLINPTGSAALATAGTGDVLAGWLGGIWAQTPRATPEGVMALAGAAVYRHGAAADARGTRLLRAGDLIEAMACG